MQTRESVQNTPASALSLRSPLRHIHGSTRKKCSLARSDFSQLVFACVHTDFGTRDLRGLGAKTQSSIRASDACLKYFSLMLPRHRHGPSDGRTDLDGSSPPSPSRLCQSGVQREEPRSNMKYAVSRFNTRIFFSPASHRGYI